MATKKNKPKPSIIVIMATRKKQTHPNHLLYLWQHQKMDNDWIPFIVDVINDYHNNSKAMKGRQQEKKIIVKVFMATWRSKISNCVLSPRVHFH